MWTTKTPWVAVAVACALGTAASASAKTASRISRR
jgi:hypothetical protein